MCKWYCMSEGLITNLACLHCGTRYCECCLHGEAGKMESLIKCAKCGKKPKTKSNTQRASWGEGGEAATKKTPTKARPEATKTVPDLSNLSDDEQLRAMFEYYASFGNPQSKEFMDNAKFAKLARETKVVDNKNVSAATVDLAFTKSKEKSERRINYKQFTSALHQLGEKKFPQNPERIVSHSLGNWKTGHGGAKKKSPAKPSVYDKLTDTKLYTGAHKERFSAEGKGKGLEGRESVPKGSPARKR